MKSLQGRSLVTAWEIEPSGAPAPPHSIQPSLPDPRPSERNFITAVAVSPAVVVVVERGVASTRGAGAETAGGRGAQGGENRQEEETQNISDGLFVSRKLEARNRDPFCAQIRTCQR